MIVSPRNTGVFRRKLIMKGRETAALSITWQSFLFLRVTGSALNIQIECENVLRLAQVRFW